MPDANIPRCYLVTVGTSIFAKISRKSGWKESLREFGDPDLAQPENDYDGLANEHMVRHQSTIAADLEDLSFLSYSQLREASAELATLYQPDASDYPFQDGRRDRVALIATRTKD